MSKFTPSLVLAGALYLFGLSTVSVLALPTRTWVSGKGLDTNPCSLAAPCRTFAYAITQTAAGGEIDVLDPAGYGALTINKSISIVNDGVGTAGVQAASGAVAITINAGASDTIHLRGLTIEGGGTGAYGIQFLSGGALAIVNCAVRHFTSVGIFLLPNTTSTFSITNTFVSDNGSTGLLISPQASAGIGGVIKA